MQSGFTLYAQMQMYMAQKTAGCYKRRRKKEKKKLKQSPNSLQLERLSVLVCSASVHREPYCALFGDANKDHLAGFSNHVCACSDFKHDGSLTSYARWKSAQAERRPLSSRIREGK